MESKKRFPADTGRVLDVLGLIKDHVLPPDSLEVLLILGDLDKKISDAQVNMQFLMYQLVACDQDVERCILIIANLFLAPEFSECRPVLGVSPVRKSFQPGYEAGNLLLPIMQCRRRRNNKERAPYVMCLSQICEQ